MDGSYTDSPQDRTWGRQTSQSSYHHTELPPVDVVGRPLPPIDTAVEIQQTKDGSNFGTYRPCRISVTGNRASHVYESPQFT